MTPRPLPSSGDANARSERGSDHPEPPGSRPPCSRPPSLPQALAALVGGGAGPQAARVVVAAAHRLAKAALRTATTNRQLQGLSLDDQAMDAIAELFERTSEGRFPVLEAYFDTCFDEEPVDDAPDALRRLSPKAALQRLRPLVQGAVTDRVFESHGETDASLSRIIRAVKRAVRNRDQAALHRRLGTVCVALAPHEPADGGRSSSGLLSAGRPTVPARRLAAGLAGAVRAGAQVPDLVDEAAAFLRGHPIYAPSVPVTLLALAIRTATVEVGCSGQAADAPAPGRRYVLPRSLRRLQTSDVEAVLDASLADVEAAKRSTYVAEGRLTPARYAAYIEAARGYLAARYLPPTDPFLTQHEALRLHLPDLTRTAYRESHRSVFEYLVRAVRSTFEERLQQHFRDRTAPSPSPDAEANPPEAKSPEANLLQSNPLQASASG